jgi:hypothetical protein
MIVGRGAMALADEDVPQGRLRVATEDLVNHMAGGVLMGCPAGGHGDRDCTIGPGDSYRHLDCSPWARS